MEAVLKLESVGCKDWLTNKVDRCVGGKVAKQQCVGPLQLPLNNVGVMALDYSSQEGVATAIGHAPIAALVDPKAGSRVAITESLTNMIWAPLKEGLQSVSLSANWMWPCKNEGEDARLYKAVEAISEFAIDLGINVPTGKDSLSMKQKYPDGDVVSPGTVIISAAGNCNAISKVVEPVFKPNNSAIYYINVSQDAYKLGGSAFGQILNKVGTETPDVKSAAYVKSVFNTLQKLIKNDHESHPKVFYDALHFWNSNEGIAVGDPINGCMSILITRDAGGSWEKTPCNRLPASKAGEAAFAASDTNIAIAGDKTWIATGGLSSRILISPDKGVSWEVVETPIVQGAETTGVFSIAFYDALNGFAIGGDFTNPKAQHSNKIRTTDGGRVWNTVAQDESPGYRSCVQYVPNSGAKGLVAVGFEGIDVSINSGQTWKHLSDTSFYTLRFLNDSVAYAAGSGRLSKLTFK